MGMLQSRRFKTAMFWLLTMISSFIVGYGIAMTARSSFTPPLAVSEVTATPWSTPQPPRRTAVLSASESLKPTPTSATALPRATATLRPTSAPTATPARRAPTVTPTSAPTAAPPLTPTPLERFVSESFDSSASGWLVRTTSRSSAGYAAGRYRLALSGQTDLGVSMAVPAAAYRLSADVAIRAGAAGLVFLAAEPATFYRLVISADGRYAIQVRQQGASAPTNLVGWSESAALRRGPEAINRLQVERVGGRVRCLANGQPLAELTLPDASFNGQYGFALADASGQGEATFDNLVGEYLPTQP